MDTDTRSRMIAPPLMLSHTRRQKAPDDECTQLDFFEEEDLHHQQVQTYDLGDDYDSD
jgi:hypothetical protein